MDLIVKSIVKTMYLAMISCFVSLFYVERQFLIDGPFKPDAASGHIVKMEVKSKTVYGTNWQYVWYSAGGICSAMIIGFTGALLDIYWKSYIGRGPIPNRTK